MIAEQGLFETRASTPGAGPVTAGDAEHTVVVHTGMRLDQSDLDGLMAAYRHESTLHEDVAPLLAIAECLALGSSHDDPDEFRRHLIVQLEAMSTRLEEAGHSDTEIMVARYMLCVVLDEFAMSSDWGKGSNWSRDSLLWNFYKETWGGEKFFELLDKLLENPHGYADLIELAHHCLQLGFHGKYGMDGENKVELMSLSRRCLVAMELVRGKHRDAQLHISADQVSKGSVARRVSPISLLAVFAIAWASVVGYQLWRAQGYYDQVAGQLAERLEVDGVDISAR